jgi:hypothetical protein
MQTKESLPKPFRNDVRYVRSLPGGTAIEAVTVPQHGVVAFVDELIHHTTPLYGPRTVSGKQLADFLEIRFPNESNAHRKSFTPFGKKPATAFTKKTWKRLTGMRGSEKRLDRVWLVDAGLPDRLVNKLFDQVYPGFRNVSVPDATKKGSAFEQRLPRLERQMSSEELRKNLPPEVTGERRFFRTWVRAVKRT